MAAFLQKFLGGAPSAAPKANDAGFADFAAAPASPSPALLASTAATAAGGSFFSAPTGNPNLPYTKWYRVWERTERKDFFAEAVIIPFILLLVLFHLWGTRSNRMKAKAWMAAHIKALQSEFAVVGFGAQSKTLSVEDVQAEGALKAEDNAFVNVPNESMQEEAKNQFITFATGRQNVAFLDVKITLKKRYSPTMYLGELLFSLLFESIDPPQERMEATLYSFDGREKELVQSTNGEPRKSSGNSTYDGYVFAIVHKDLMRRLRDERYDLSLTSTKDHAKLPAWATVMSESAEITEAMLTPELIKAVEECGDDFEAFVISDQPIEKPTKLQETLPKKRVTLSIRLPSGSSSPASYNASLPLFKTFLRFPDHLVSTAHFRPEVLRRVKTVREDEIKRIRKIDDDEKAEERKNERDKAKKEKRDKELRGLSSDQQRKFLEKEREKEQRKGAKKMTVKG